MLGCGANTIFHPVMRQNSLDDKIRKDLARDELRRAAAEIFENISTGPMVEKKGIFLGRYKLPSGTNGKTICLEFYEASEPLTIDFGNKHPSKENAALTLAGLKDWHDHEGGYFANSDNICDALIDGRYRVHINSIDYHGQWFFKDMLLHNDIAFPTRETYHLCRAERLANSIS